MAKLIDLTGQRFGRLVVVCRAGSDSKKNAVWRCRCDCGTEKIINGSSLRNGRTKSCGCYNDEIRADGCRKRATHGMKGTRLYKTWQNMKSRCYREKDISYPNYGGRGIKVCDEWLHSFEAFRDWALANGYRDNLTIDRKNPNGNYEPSNCRWQNSKQQANNRRSNKYLVCDGKRLTYAEWADLYGITERTISRRIAAGWDAERAIKEPMKGAKSCG